jgi:hypothetical protein
MIQTTSMARTHSGGAQVTPGGTPSITGGDVGVSLGRLPSDGRGPISSKSVAAALRTRTWRGLSPYGRPDAVPTEVPRGKWDSSAPLFLPLIHGRHGKQALGAIDGASKGVGADPMPATLRVGPSGTTDDRTRTHDAGSYPMLAWMPGTRGAGPPSVSGAPTTSPSLPSDPSGGKVPMQPSVPGSRTATSARRRNWS